MRTYVITGATSFIGSWLVKRLLGEGHRVIAVVRNHPKAVSKLGTHPQLELVEAGIDDYHCLADFIPQADVFVHFAWAGTGHDGRNVEEIQQSNISCTQSALQVAAKLGCTLFVDSGSQAEYGTQLGPITEDTPCQPFSAYGKAKLAAYESCRTLAQQLGMKYLHLRIFSLFGLGDHPWTLVMTCIDRMLRNEPVELSPCTQQWNFLNVVDAAEQIARLCTYALDKPTFTQEVFNIASDDTRPLHEFVEEIKKLTHSESTLLYGAIQPANYVSLNPDTSRLTQAVRFVCKSTFSATILEIIRSYNNTKPHNAMIKVSDFIFQHLVQHYGIRHCFLVTGGGAMHLNDSLGHTEGLTYVCNHHEQASAIAGEGYYRASGRLAVTCVTTGPGGTNAITGVLGQWLDSIPGLYISGQVKQSTTIAACPELPLRQLGDQEADIKSMVQSITKYCVTITDVRDVKYELDKAIAIALGGRPGPVWVDVPLDIQGAMVDEAELREFDPSELADPYDHALIDEQLRDLFQRIHTAKSPVIYVGNGVRLAHREEQFITLAERLGIPVVTAISGSDIIWHDHPLCFGKPGICGDRIGNIMVQNSDLLIVMGTRLSIRQVSYAYDLLAPHAYKVMIDADAPELSKPTLNIDLKIHALLDEAIDKMLGLCDAYKTPDFAAWREWGRNIEAKLPTLFDDNPDCEGYTNSYKFADELFQQLHDGDVVVTGNGTAYTCTYQAMKVKQGVRVFANQGCAAMGYGLPAAIGACVSNEKGRTVCVTGDGSIQMNLQELQTLVTYRLPLKLFVLENESYLAIKTTQKSFFKGRFTGSNPASGVVCPSLEKIAAAYGIPYVSISENGEALTDAIRRTLAADGPCICEVHMHPEQTLFPKSASFMDKETGRMSSAPLEKMAPFMPDDLQQQCVYKP